MKFAPELEPELLLGAGWEGRASWCETATARAASVEANGLKLLGAGALRGYVAAITGRTALGGFDRLSSAPAWEDKRHEE